MDKYLSYYRFIFFGYMQLEPKKIKFFIQVNLENEKGKLEILSKDANERKIGLLMAGINEKKNE